MKNKLYAALFFLTLSHPTFAQSVDLKQYWPTPQSGYLLKYYQRPDGQLFIQRHYRNSTDGSYRLEEFYKDYPFANKWNWLHTWYYKFDQNRGIVEYADDSYNIDKNRTDYTRFRAGSELLWGNFLKVGDDVHGTLYIPSYNLYGYVKTQLVQQVGQLTVNNVPYSDVVKIFNYQSFCESSSSCSNPNVYTGYYYMAPKMGFIKVEYADSQGVPKTGPGSYAELIQQCTTTSPTKYTCP